MMNKPRILYWTGALVMVGAVLAVSTGSGAFESFFMAMAGYWIGRHALDIEVENDNLHHIS